MDYGFGCKIHDLMFKLNTPATRSHARMYIYEALIRWEIRVDIKRIDISDDSSSELIIDIEYIIKEINVIDNLVYPFYLLEPK